MQIVVIFLFSAIVFGFGYMFGCMCSTNGNQKQSEQSSKPEQTPKVDKEKLHIWAIVRYSHDGKYDCVWSSGYTKRDAEKKCKQLNNDYHKNYGKYVVEDGFFED